MIKNSAGNQDNILLHQLLLSFDYFTISQIINIALFLLSIFGAFFIVRKNKNAFYSPAFIISSLFIIFYQIPLTLYSSVFKKAISNYWLFDLNINAVVFFGLIWALLTAKLSFITVKKTYDLNEGIVEAEYKQSVFLVSILCFILVVSLTSIYLLHVPIQCTGLYSIIFDPNLSGLARELSIKLINSSVASNAFGALVNTVIPTSAAILVFQFKKYIKSKKILTLLLTLLLVFLEFLVVLLPGIKGLLIPTFMAVLFMQILMCKSLPGKLFNAILCIALFFMILTGFESFRERPAFLNDVPKYNAGICAVHFKTCNQTDLLVKSLFYRVGSLGLTNFDKKFVKSQIDCFCYKQCATFDNYLNYIKKLDKPYPDVRIYPDIKGYYVIKNNLERIEKNFKAIIYRVILLPIQVASWHYLYVTQNTSPGMYVLPFAKHILGYSLMQPQ